MRSICEPLHAQVERAGLVWRLMAVAGGGHLKSGSVDPYDSAFPSSLDGLGGACPSLTEKGSGTGSQEGDRHLLHPHFPRDSFRFVAESRSHSGICSPLSASMSTSQDSPAAYNSSQIWVPALPCDFSPLSCL